MQAIARKTWQISNVITIYGVTLLTLWQGVKAFLPALDSNTQSDPTLSGVYALRKQPELPKQEIITGKPVRLVLEALNFDREVVPGVYNDINKTWQVLPRAIHFAELSQPANNHAGNTLIYAHNNRHAFGPLKKLKVGDKAKLYTENDYLFTYKLVQLTDHSPNDTAIFSYRGEPLLTLMTCSGPFNEIRTFYTFQLENVQSHE